jgi:hypothetical protein
VKGHIASHIWCRIVYGFNNTTLACGTGTGVLVDELLPGVGSAVVGRNCCCIGALPDAFTIMQFLMLRLNRYLAINCQSKKWPESSNSWVLCCHIRYNPLVKRLKRKHLLLVRSHCWREVSFAYLHLVGLSWRTFAGRNFWVGCCVVGTAALLLRFLLQQLALYTHRYNPLVKRLKRKQLYTWSCIICC